MDHPYAGKGYSEYQITKRKLDSLEKLRQRLDKHQSWLQTDAGREWKERQLMELEDIELNATENAIALYEAWYEEMENEKPTCLEHNQESCDEFLCQPVTFGKKYKNSTIADLLKDNNYITWIKTLKPEENKSKNAQFLRLIRYIQGQSFFDKK